jgi:hypothetical protein
VAEEGVAAQAADERIAAAAARQEIVAAEAAQGLGGGAALEGVIARPAVDRCRERHRRAGHCKELAVVDG